MSSLCKPADQTPLLQRLMLDGVIPSSNIQYPNIQYKEKNQRRKLGKSRSVYWTDNLTISEPSSNLSHYYYTTLVIGATAVCSAGALMQHVKTGLWHQSDSLTSDKTVVQSEKSESVTTVVTPPIAASQTTASFSSRVDHSSRVDQALKGEQFQTAQVHQLRTHQAILAHRSADLANRQAELEENSKQLNQRVAHLTTYLDIHPDDVEQVANLLDTDTTYQINRLKLNNLKEAIALEYSKPVIDNPQLEVLYDQYTQELDQLRQIAQNVLANYITNVGDEFDEKSYNLLQELIDLAHFRQIQVIQHNMLAQMDTQLSQQRTELAVLLSQNSSVGTLGAS